MDSPPPPAPPPPRNVVLLGVLFEGGLGLLAVMISWLLGRPLVELLHWSGQDALWGLAATGPLLVALGAMIRWPVGPLARLSAVVRELAGTMFARVGVAGLAVISVAAGIGEELLFRGLIQSSIDDRFGPAVGLIAGAVAFGLAHPITRTYAVVAGVMGLYLGGLYLLTGNLLAPMITHAVYDFVALVVVVRWKV